MIYRVWHVKSERYVVNNQTGLCYFDDDPGGVNRVLKSRGASEHYVFAFPFCGEGAAQLVIGGLLWLEKPRVRNKMIKEFLASLQSACVTLGDEWIDQEVVKEWE